MTWAKGTKIETLDKEVIKYSALGEVLLTVFEEREELKRSLHISQVYVRRNSSYEIAKRFVELFESLTKTSAYRAAA